MGLEDQFVVFQDIAEGVVNLAALIFGGGCWNEQVCARDLLGMSFLVLGLRLRQLAGLQLATCKITIITLVIVDRIPFQCAASVLTNLPRGICNGGMQLIKKLGNCCASSESFSLVPLLSSHSVHLYSFVSLSIHLILLCEYFAAHIVVVPALSCLKSTALLIHLAALQPGHRSPIATDISLRH